MTVIKYVGWQSSVAYLTSRVEDSAGFMKEVPFKFKLIINESSPAWYFIKAAGAVIIIKIIYKALI